MSAAQFVMTVFSHDSYIMSLPPYTYRPFYMHFPLYDTLLNYQKRHITHAPIIRLFGTTPAGQKACVHVHGYFPFFYIKVEHLRQGFQNQDYLNTFLGLVENLYQQAYKYKFPVIFNGELEQKYDFYGYHSSKQLFIKIYVYDQHSVAKLKDLFSSRIINGQMLQPYEAHINHFMHFFGELNIFGLHEMLFTDFKFRKNIIGQEVFQKISSLNTDNLSLCSGINLNQIYSQNPHLFSILQKSSPCYLQLDIHYERIVNYLYSMMTRINNQQEARISLNSVDVEEINSGQRKFKVQITRALNQFWFDEKQRRQRLGINSQVSIKLDLSKNIESRQEVQKGEMDPFWMNFINKKQIKEHVKRYVKSYSQAKKQQSTSKLFVDKHIVQNYGEVLDKQMEDMIVSVTNRWKFYSQRSRSIIEKMMKGQTKQIPDWDQLSELSQSEGQQQDWNKNKATQQNQASLYDQMMNQQSHTNNYAIFRNNYTINKAILKKDGYFSICDFCKSIKSKCRCGQFKDIKELQKHTSKFFCNKTSSYKRLKYIPKPPSRAQTIKQSVCQSQFPYYSSISDFFDHYKISKVFPRTRQIAQLLDFEIKPPKKFTNVVGLPNKEKLPSFWRIGIPYQQNIVATNDYLKLKYKKPPPRIIQLLAQKSQMKQQKKSEKYIKQNVFVCDIVEMNFEMICQSSNFYSNPQSDRIKVIIYSLVNQIDTSKRIYGAILVAQDNLDITSYSAHIMDIFVVPDQKSLLYLFALLVFKSDPDLLVSYDHEKKGIYYLTMRGYHHKMNYCDLLGRAPAQLDEIFDIVTFKNFKMLRSGYFTEEFLVGRNLSTTTNSTDQAKIDRAMQTLQKRKKKAPILRKNYNFYINVKGRVCINISRIVQWQKKLRCYTIQYISKVLFNNQLPEFTDKYLHQISIKDPSFAISYTLTRVVLLTDILQKLNSIGGLIEKCKLYGCNFAAMLERGSQFKIEAIMSRVCMHSDYLLLSATKIQVSEQKVLECRPLVLQPSKQLYVDPVLVFDFQSLYPSIMIAFNLCYSTCLGNIKQLFNKDTRKKRFGVSKNSDIDLRIIQQIFQNFQQEQALKKLERYIFVTPNKVAFLRKNIRQGILPRMLLEFLMSRIMIKNSSPLYKSQTVHKLLHERQAAMKLFMNVTFGYTGASFSGRMPCGQLADSVVELSKFCLTNCISQMDGNQKYGGKVIYGDTDSIFYLLKGKSMEEAFKLGKIVAQEITKKFPYPIQLKFEKVYESLVLVSKKRYYGKKFQSFGGKPKFQGKGLQCVRRDTVDLVSNNMQNLLNQLFNTKDLSKVKKMFQQSVSKLKANLLPPIDLVFAKQVKLLKYGNSVPAHGTAARKLQNIDVMLAPKYGQRMKYVVLKQGQTTIKDRALPLFLYQNQQLDIDYYLSKHLVPSLQRVFTSIVNLGQWALSAPSIHNPLLKNMFSKKHCLVCESPNTILCSCCYQKVQEKMLNVLMQKQNKEEICKECIGCKGVDEKMCVQWNCSNLWDRRRAVKRNDVLIPQLTNLSKLIEQFNK